MKVSLPVSAQNTWSAQFELLGDAHYAGKPARALVSVVQGTADSTVTLRRYSGSTVIQSLTMTKGQVVEVPVTGMYDIGVATGAFGTGEITITVEQDRP